MFPLNDRQYRILSIVARWRSISGRELRALYNQETERFFKLGRSRFYADMARLEDLALVTKEQIDKHMSPDYTVTDKGNQYLTWKPE